MHSSLVAATLVATAAAGFRTVDPILGSSSRKPYSQADWMGASMPVIGNLSLLDITLPGTHDTNTWDLGTTVADNSNDIPPWAAYLAHDIHNFAGLGDFIHEQAQSQTLNLTQQLDAGIRFLDFRADWSAPINESSAKADKYQWYSLHLLESTYTCLDLFGQVKAWMLAHPTEVVVLWVSHWGDSCGDHYHWTTKEQMHKFFLSYTELFGDLVFDGLLNETSIGSMVSSNKRAVFYIASYDNMTAGGSNLAQNACGGIDNNLGASLDSLPNTYNNFKKSFMHAQDRRIADKKTNTIYLQSMTMGNPKDQIFDQLKIQYLHDIINTTTFVDECSKSFHIPGQDHFCPRSLRQGCQLGNYYNQWFFEESITNPKMFLPGAIYINVVGQNGTLCTQVDQINRNDTGVCSGGAFSYVDTVVLYNLVKMAGCSMTESHMSPDCAAVAPQVKASRDLYPATYYSDPAHGRHADWPFKL